MLFYLDNHQGDMAIPDFPGKIRVLGLYHKRLYDDIII